MHDLCPDCVQFSAAIKTRRPTSAGRDSHRRPLAVFVLGRDARGTQSLCAWAGNPALLSEPLSAPEPPPLPSVAALSRSANPSDEERAARLVSLVSSRLVFYRLVPSHLFHRLALRPAVSCRLSRLSTLARCGWSYNFQGDERSYTVTDGEQPSAVCWRPVCTASVPCCRQVETLPLRRALLPPDSARVLPVPSVPTCRSSPPAMHASLPAAPVVCSVYPLPLPFCPLALAVPCGWGSAL